MKKYWPLSLPFLFFGTFYFLLRIKPQLDMYVMERNYRNEILQSGSANVISCGHHNWPDPDITIGQIKGNDLNEFLANIHLRPVPDRRMFYCFDKYTTYFVIRPRQKSVSQSMMLMGDRRYIGSTNRPSILSGLLSRFYRYELTPESGRALEHFLVQRHFVKASKVR